MEADRRRCIRLVVPDQRLGTLFRGQRRYPVEVLDESARGFGVLVETSDSFRIDQRYILSTDNGSSQVRVKYIEELPEGQRLGLERLSEIAGAAPKVKFSLRPVLRWFTWSVALVGATFGLTIAGAVLIAILVNHHYSKPRPVVHGFLPPPESARAKTTRRPTSASRTPASRPAEAPRHSPPGVMDKVGATATGILDATQNAADRPARQAIAAGKAGADAAASVGALTRERLNEWRTQLEQLPWQSQRLAPLVSDQLLQLNLSAEQQEAIGLAITRVIANLQSVAKNIGSGAEGASIAKNLEAGAVQEITAVFTPSQREKWEQIATGPIAA